MYGDFVTGKIWALRPNGKGTFDNQELAHTVICFSEEATGELLVLDYAGGIYELERNTDHTRSGMFPVKPWRRDCSNQCLFNDRRLASSIFR